MTSSSAVLGLSITLLAAFKATPDLAEIRSTA